MVQLLLPLGMAALLSMPLVVHGQAPNEVVRTDAGVERPVDAAVWSLARWRWIWPCKPILKSLWRCGNRSQRRRTSPSRIIPNPVLSAQVEDTRYRDTRTTTVQISQPLELGGKRSARIAAAERARDLAMAELNAKRAEIRATVDAAFIVY